MPYYIMKSVDMSPLNCRHQVESVIVMPYESTEKLVCLLGNKIELRDWVGLRSFSASDWISGCKCPTV